MCILLWLCMPSSLDVYLRHGGGCRGVGIGRVGMNAIIACYVLRSTPSEKHRGVLAPWLQVCVTCIPHTAHQGVIYA
jgi:hypothetical protein